MHKISVGFLFLVATLPCLAQTNDSIADALTRDLDVLASENLMVGFSVALYNKEGTLVGRRLRLRPSDRKTHFIFP